MYVLSQTAKDVSVANKSQLTILRKGVNIWNRWRIANPSITPNLIKADLSNLNLSRANLSRANLSEANLSGANLSRANLIGADFTKANLTGANLRGGILKGANLSKAYLFATNFNRANLTAARLQQADVIAANLSGAHLCEADLQEANLSGSDLREVLFRDANLSYANLSRTQSLAANFTAATLTGACLDSWHVNSMTKLYEVTCDYVYLKWAYVKKQDKWVLQDRYPDKGHFAPREFSQEFQIVAEPVDLVFVDEIDWSAFLTAFERLQAEQRLDEELIEEGEGISIQAIESEKDGTFVIRIRVPPELDKVAVEQDFQLYYESELRTRNELLQLRDEEASLYQEQVELKRQKGTDILEIVKIMAHEAIPRCDLRDAQIYNRVLKRLGAVR